MKKIFFYLNIYILLFLFTVISCNGKPKVITIDKSINDYNGITFIQGMNGCENIYLDNDSLKIYVTDLKGYVHLIDGESKDNLKIVKSKKICTNCCLGIDKGPDNNLYIAACDDDWLKIGGYIVRVDLALNKIVKITEKYKGINGLCFDDSSNLYFAAGDMNFFNPGGNIYNFKINIIDNNYKPEIFLKNIKSPNGMYYDKNDNSMYFTEVFTGLSRINLETHNINFIFGKTRIVEGFDDICIDKHGNFWVADQPNGFLKKYDPIKKIVSRYKIKEFGIASSCRIRIENGEEIIYITEIKKPRSNKYDGRGIISIPLSEFYK